MRLQSSPRIVLLMVVLCFLARGVFYCSFTPLWEGYDEWAHFALIQQIASTGRPLIDRAEPVPRDVWASMNLSPAPWDTGKPFLTEDDFWKLPAGERDARAKAFETLPLKWVQQTDHPAAPIYEALQPPLYYWILSAFYRLIADLPLADRVLLVRCVSLAIAALALPLIFQIARRIFRNSVAALLVVALTAALPELMIDVCRAGNECLGIVLFSWLTLLLLQPRKEPALRTAVWTGVALGLGLLTKAYFLTAIPAMLLIYLVRLRHGRTWIRDAAVTSGMAFAIAGWWYVRNRITTGTWSGLLESAKLVHYTIPQFWHGAMNVNWRNAVDSILFSHIWFGGWSSLHVRSWMYHALFVVIGAGVAGVIVASMRHKQRVVIFPLAAIYGFFWIGQLYNVVLLFLTKGASTSMGWYMYCVIAAEVTLLVLGLQALLPDRTHAWIISTLIMVMGVLDLYTVNFVSIPYYTGLTAHRANNGAVSAFHFSSLDGVGIAGVGDRLRLMKPLWMTASAQGLSYVLYLSGTLVLMALPFWLTSRSSRIESSGATEERDELPSRRGSQTTAG